MTVITEMIYLFIFYYCRFTFDQEKYKNRNVKSLLTTILLYRGTVVLLERSLEQHDNPQIYKHTVGKKKATARELLVL